MVSIYVFECENGKYYVCKGDSDKKFRIKVGGEWINKYKPLKMIYCIPYDRIKNVTYYTKKYMKLYGINNVRGGEFYTLILTPQQIITLGAELFKTKHICSHCASTRHTRNICDIILYNDTDEDNTYEDNTYEDVYERCNTLVRC